MLEQLRDASPEFDDLCRIEGDAGKALLAAEPTIVACGLLKAGKSTLLNVLTGHLNDEYFAVGASRTTVVPKSFTLAGIRYTDTPGLDANEADDQAAWQAIGAADYFLFVHHAGVAALDRSEVAFLERLLLRRADAPARLLLVLTHADIHEAAGLALCVAELGAQVSRIVGAQVAVCPVASAAYSRGRREDKRTLVARSGIPDLIERLARPWSEPGALLSMRAAAAAARRVRIRAILDERIAAVGAAVTGLETTIAARSAGMADDVLALRTHVRQRLMASGLAAPIH